MPACLYSRLVQIGCLTLILLLTGCATTDEPEVLGEKEYYDKARSALARGNFSEATIYLEALETYHPFGRYAEQAQLDLIFAKYNALDSAGAESAADRFIRLRPDSANVDYAHYIKGLSAYYADQGLALRYLPLDETARDAGRAREAFNTFDVLVREFPDSPYAADAEQRMVALRNRMAEHELHVARYYLKRDALVAALNRARSVIEDFPEAPAVADALAMTVEISRLLKLEETAADALAVLALNFPGHRSLDENRNFRGGMIPETNRDLSRLLELGWSD